MTANQKQIQVNIIAFLLLFFVSMYRQISLYRLSDDPCRTYIMYICYVILIGTWMASIWLRVTQKNMRNFLLMEAVVIFIGITIRFLQDTFWYENVMLMRVSGLFVEATLLPGLLFGLYASLGIGQWDNYRIPRKWYLFLIPVVVMTMFTVTDEKWHFMFYITLDEPQPNLRFHPYIGTFLLAGIALILMLTRIGVIYRKNQMTFRYRFLRWFIPLFEPILILIFSFGYFASSLGILPALAKVEVIELFAKIYYIEILTWEFYIYMGLVPVNTKYPEIFEHATVGMTLLGEDGYCLLSKAAKKVTKEQFEELKNKEYILLDSGKELHMHRLPEGYFLWNKDVSELQKMIVDLNQSGEALAQESVLLEEELKTRNQEAKILAKNQIYDELIKEVKGQLNLMKEMTRKQNTDIDSEKLLRNLCLLGTYVKRRCNLRLIQKETGVIYQEDLQLSFRDMVSAMKLMGIHAEIHWHLDRDLPAEFSIYLFDQLEAFLEQEQFEMEEMKIVICKKRIEFKGNHSFVIEIPKGGANHA